MLHTFNNILHSHAGIKKKHANYYNAHMKTLSQNVKVSSYIILEIWESQTQHCNRAFIIIIIILIWLSSRVRYNGAKVSGAVVIDDTSSGLPELLLSALCELREAQNNQASLQYGNKISTVLYSFKLSHIHASYIIQYMIYMYQQLDMHLQYYPGM